MFAIMYRSLSALCLLVTLALPACSEPARPTMSLYRAVHMGDLDQIKRHLHWLSDLNQPEPTGDYPLHVAARNGSVNITRALIEQGADPLVRDAAGATPLEVALLHGKTQVARTLAEHQVAFDPQALLVELAREGVSDRDSFEFLIRRGADPDQADANGDRPLHLAIARGRFETVNRLLLLGADVNQPDAAGRLPLDLALKPSGDRRDDRAKIVDLLQRNGARGARTDKAPSDSAPKTPIKRNQE